MLTTYISTTPTTTSYMYGMAWQRTHPVRCTTPWPRFHPYVQVLCLFVIILAGENADAIDADDAMHGLVFPWDFDKRIKFGVAVHCVRRKHTRAILLCNGHVHCVCTRADGIVRERVSEKGPRKDETYLNT